MTIKTQLTKETGNTPFSLTRSLTTKLYELYPITMNLKHCIISAFIVLLKQHTNKSDFKFSIVMQNAMKQYQPIPIHITLSTSLSFYDLVVQVDEQYKKRVEKDLPDSFEQISLIDDINKVELIIQGEKGDVVESQITGWISYDEVLYHKETMIIWTRHFNNIFISIAQYGSENLISEINMLDKDEEEQIRNEFNLPYAITPQGINIISEFEQQVNLHGNEIAIKYEEKTLTYQELNEMSNQIARVLIKKGVTKDTVVGIMMNRSLELLTGIISILKAGGAYLPIDPDFPEQRIKYMLEDSECKIILVDDCLNENKMFQDQYHIEVIDVNQELIEQEDQTNLSVFIHPNDLAYIIYTSGTTGMPKGVMIEHRNVVSLLKNDRLNFDFNDRDVWTMFHSYCFDFSVWEMFGSLLNGGKLIIVPKWMTNIPEKLLEMLKLEKVTVFNQTPNSFYHVMNEELENEDRALSLRYVIFGGESLKMSKLAAWKNKYPDIRLINMYGITETTIHVTFKEIHDHDIHEKMNNIGKPVSTLHAYILNKDLQLTPIGIEGELYISGAGLGRGYMNNPNLTYEKYVINPFDHMEKLYKTGDLARWLTNGEIEYLGRADDQVSIRGFRIELEEIENQLLSHDKISDVRVMKWDQNNSGDFLCAYYVLRSTEDEIDTDELKKHAMKQLPEYMIPSFFVKLDEIPMNQNGKTNKGLFRNPKEQIKQDDSENIQLINDELIYQDLKQIWSEILEIPKGQIGIITSFFDLGGNSLLIIQLSKKIKDTLGVDIPVVHLFRHTTIQLQAEYLLQQTEEKSDNLPENVESQEHSEDRLKHTIRLMEGFMDDFE